MARHSKFKDEFLRIIEKLARKGLTDKEIADVLNVTEQTFNNWKKENQVFFESLKSWKEEADQKVEKSLYERALGYSHPEDKIFCDTKTGQIHVQPTIKHYPPDTVACIFWLKNRKRLEWRDKVDHELSGPNGGPIPIKNMTDTVLDEEIKKAEKALKGNGSRKANSKQ